MIEVTVARDGAPWLAQTVSTAPISIGRAPENDVVLIDPYVSLRHATLAISRGRLLLRDTSSNGTLVDGEPIEARQLAAGDVVTIGPFTLRFALSPAAPARTLQSHDLADAAVPELAPPPPMPPAPPTPPPQTAELAVSTATGLDLVEVADERAPNACASLEVIEGPPSVHGRRVMLEPAAITIGRGAEADICLDASTVSRCHARLVRNASGGWRIEDLGSANGTFVDEQRIVSSRLAGQHRIRFGTEVVARFRPQPRTDDTLQPEPGELEIDLHRAPGTASVLVVRVEGRVDGYSYSQLGRRLQSLIDAGEHRLVLDLSGVAFIDHTGLGVLVNAATAIDRAGGRLRLVGVGEPLQRALSLSRLDMFFRGRIARDCGTAIRALEGPLSPLSQPRDPGRAR